MGGKKQAGMATLLKIKSKQQNIKTPTFYSSRITETECNR